MDTLRKEKVDFSILVRVTPENVFDALATAEGLNEWFTQGTELEQRKGGRLLLRFEDYGLDHYTDDFPGKVLEWRSAWYWMPKA